jgi:hypothetical protein
MFMYCMILTTRSTFGIGLLVEGLVLIVAFGLGLVASLPPFGSFALDPAALATGVAATAPPLMALAAFARARPAFFSSIERAILAALGPWLRDAPGWQLVTLAAVAGLAEEGLFRGVFQVGAAGIVGVAPAIVLCGVAFGLAHAVTPGYAVYATAMGVYLGIIMALTDNIAVPALVHGLYDAAALGFMRARARSVSPVTESRGPMP